jgi:sensor histidine kinase YesM
MNPHFIFNSLGAIQHFMLKNDGRKAAFYLSSFSSLMRSILKNSREELITLREEKQTLENYLLLHQLRLGNRLSFEVNIADELDVEETILPPMLIQPFVENAIIHGIEKMEDNGAIVVVFSKESNLLKIIVKDNGKGIDQNPAGTKENHVSYALQIFEERIANLKKSSGINISYKIGNIVVAEDQNQGTVVTVLLPLKLR